MSNSSSPASRTPSVAASPVRVDHLGIHLTLDGRRFCVPYNPSGELPPNFVETVNLPGKRTRLQWMSRDELDQCLSHLKDRFAESDERLEIPRLSPAGPAPVDPQTIRDLYVAADLNRHAIETHRDPRNNRVIAYRRNVGNGETEEVWVVRFDGKPSIRYDLHDHSNQHRLEPERILVGFSTKEISDQANKEAQQAFARLYGRESALDSADVNPDRGNRLPVDQRPAFGPPVGFGRPF